MSTPKYIYTLTCKIKTTTDSFEHVNFNDYTEVLKDLASHLKLKEGKMYGLSITLDAVDYT